MGCLNDSGHFFAKFQISNGRKTGDLFGGYTSFQWNGNNVVNCVLMTHALYNRVMYFKVWDYIPWLSNRHTIQI